MICMCVCEFPVSLSVGIMFVSYALHTRYMPFLDPLKPEVLQELGSRGAIASGVQLIYVRCGFLRVQHVLASVALAQ